MIAAEQVRSDLSRCPFGFDCSSPMLDLSLQLVPLFVDALIDLLSVLLIDSLSG